MSCALKTAFCPECGGDINYRKKDKEFCNCKKCDWLCQGLCSNNDRNEQQETE